MSEGKSRKRPAITVDEAVRHVAAHQHVEARKEFSRTFYMDGKEILILGVSCPQEWPGFPNPPRDFRIETFVDGTYKNGISL